MSNLSSRQKKLQDKRKKTTRREFVKQIASRQPNVFYKFNGLVSRFPETDRVGRVVKHTDYYQQENDAYIHGHDYDENLGFFENWKKLRMALDSTNMINFFHSENSDY